MKTILITGASSGIGKETAILFSERGWNVAATMRNPEKRFLLEDYKNIQTYIMDVKDLSSVKSCIQKVIEDYGKIDVIVNNAGVYTIDPLELTSDEIMNNIIDTNIKGVLNTTKEIVNHFRKNHSGMIINISSIAGRITLPFHSVYHTSKWAVEGLSESLYYELNPLNIQVKLIEPGVVKTNLYESISELSSQSYPEEYRHPFQKFHNWLMMRVKKGYPPRQDAENIYKAANSQSSRLRYPSDVTTKFAFFFRWLFPLSLFRTIIKKVSGI